MLAGVRRRRFRLAERGVEIAALDWGGDGPLALLHHANGFCAAVWGPVAERLTGHFRVVAVDARGHGDSSRPEGQEAYAWSQFVGDLLGVAEALLAETGQERVALGLGHSFGGTTSLTAAGVRPELFQRVVAADPVIHPRDPDTGELVRIDRGNSLAEGALRRRQRFPSLAAARERYEGRDTFAGWDPRAFDLYLAEGMRQTSDGVELKCPGSVEAAIFSSGGTSDLLRHAPSVEADVLLLRAEDGAFPLTAFDMVAKRLQRAHLETMRGGHFLAMQHPDALADRVLRFCGASAVEPSRP